jgi:carboxylesterase type B
VPSSEVLKKTMAFVSPAFGTAVLPENPAVAMRAGRFLPVPVLSGNNHDEATSWVAAFDGGGGGRISAVTVRVTGGRLERVDHGPDLVL